MPTELKDLVIGAPMTGIGQSPYLGYGDVRNMDINTFPNVAKVNQKLTKKSGSTVTNLPNWSVENPKTYGDTYFLDKDGVLYKVVTGGTTSIVTGNTFTVTIASPAVFSATAHGLVANDTVKFATTGALPTGLTAGTTYYVISAGLTANAFEVSTSEGGAAVNTSGTQSGTHTFKITLGANGNGLAYFRDYLVIARNTALDFYGPLSGTAIWTNNWQADTTLVKEDTLWHPMFESKNDGKLYGGAYNEVFSIEEKAGQTFAPGTAASYTFVASEDVTLPKDRRIKCIEELGNTLLFGTWGATTTNLDQLRIADIFTWDGSSSFFTNIIPLNTCGVHAMKAIGTLVYVLAGLTGDIYVTNSVQATKIAKLPESVISIFPTGGQVIYQPGAIANYDGRLFFGVSGGGGHGANGVWSLNPTGNILNLEHGISTGGWGATTDLYIGTIMPMFYSKLRVGWEDDTTYGIDDLTNFYTSYAAYFESPLYQVGTALNKRQFTQGEIYMAKELASGEGVRLKYRINLTDSWTTIGTYDFATYGAITTLNFTLNILETDFLQIRVELTTSGTSDVSPHFREMRLR